MTDTSSPLSSPSPDHLLSIFSADPLTLSDKDYMHLVTEARRRRSEHLASEATKSLTKVKKEKPTKTPVPAATSAALDKPATEINLEDLL